MNMTRSSCLLSRRSPIDEPPQIGHLEVVALGLRPARDDLLDPGHEQLDQAEADSVDLDGQVELTVQPFPASEEAPPALVALAPRLSRSDVPEGTTLRGVDLA